MKKKISVNQLRTLIREEFKRLHEDEAQDGVIAPTDVIVQDVMTRKGVRDGIQGIVQTVNIVGHRSLLWAGKRAEQQRTAKDLALNAYVDEKVANLQRDLESLVKSHYDEMIAGWKKSV